MINSKQLFDLLSLELTKKIAGLVISIDDKWCSFSQKGASKFAYIQLAKKSPKLSIWCNGNVDEITTKYFGKIKFLTRKESRGEFGKNYKINFIIENEDDVKNAIPMLFEVSACWSKDELLVAYNFYCKISLQDINIKNSQIIIFSELVNKTPQEIVKRFRNFSRLDAAVQILENIDNQDIETQSIFNSNWETAVFRSEKLLFDFEREIYNENNFPKGKERETFVKTRVNQQFFRQAVLTSYGNKCCITGISCVELLNASHIVPWAVDNVNRLNPRNGLCLNALHDRAFDRGFLTVTTDYTVKISKIIVNIFDNNFIKDAFLLFQNNKIILPQRFFPEKAFLEYHNKEIFVK